ncbi:glycosyltransferase [Proteus mirabilis]|uniref:Glycosyltransferase n=1 Tax=Proteus mirabilis TaxID=584 RepID=A0ABD5LTC0_PROMI
MKKIAVIMSVYHGDSVEAFNISMSSIFSQSYKYFDLYLQVDGNISVELLNVIQHYARNHHNFYVELIEREKGLAWQLNRAIDRLLKNTSYSFIARMDADDICEPTRFQKQIEYFESNPHVAVCGTQVTEFHDNGYTQIKRIPTEHHILYKNIIKRCPFNHPTVMFNLSKIKIHDIKYNASLMNTQDYYLWIELLAKGYVFGNLDESLLKFRINNDFHSRRGIKKAKNDFKARLYAIRKLKIANFKNFSFLFLIVFLRVSPAF